MFKILRLLLLILLMAWLFEQVRKPKGWLGRRVAQAMNLSHAAMTEWGPATDYDSKECRDPGRWLWGRADRGETRGPRARRQGRWAGLLNGKRRRFTRDELARD